MLSSNRQVIENYKKLDKRAISEIRKKCLNKLQISQQKYFRLIRKYSFTVEERKIFDEICKPYFEIRPEVLEEQQIIK